MADETSLTLPSPGLRAMGETGSRLRKQYNTSTIGAFISAHLS